MRTCIGSLIILALCASLGSGCLMYRSAAEEPTKTGTVLATLGELAMGTLLVAACEDDTNKRDEATYAPCPSGTTEILTSGIALGVGLDLIGLVGWWLIRDIK